MLFRVKPADSESAQSSRGGTILAKIVQQEPTPLRRRRPRWAAEEAHKSLETTGTDERYHSRTIERALDVLESFDANQPGMSLKELTAKTHLPESTLFRILLTLQKRGYLQQQEDGTYQLARKVLLGRVYDSAETLRLLVRPHLEELASQFNETASLAYLFGNYVQVLDTVETFHQIRVTNRRGRILPPHCSSMGKVIVAFQPSEVTDSMLEVYGLTRRTERSIVDRQALRQELERVRQQGFACDREESMLGGICFGAPVISATGQIVAAVSVSSPVQRMTAEREKTIQQKVIATAQTVSRKLQQPARRPS
jgi:DNA-binding IclR family transcriptional regulator